MVRTLNAGLAPSSSRQRTAAVQRLAAAMCRAVPKSKSLQVASTSEIKQTQKSPPHSEAMSEQMRRQTESLGHTRSPPGCDACNTTRMR